MWFQWERFGWLFLMIDRESPTKGEFFDITLSHENYQRLTIPAGLWVAFAGVGEDLNLLLNVANLEHDPLEIERKESLDAINYRW